ncbi:di-heme enzyme [Vibrio rotiferianus]|jgi:cytochrome c peroxidase|uniref:Di-heme enzyme n=1 Tax=Vibrio rotiferianus TaxID=190895 RepID=A0A510I416_9VIBR|nr:methanobactin export MATE transporter MbnM [Vibrio rotiferianus]TMX42125.1 di-heme enzyme [Vibrio rotiferianus]TMX58334.1 di-heme enzyme [Vibrio rotiferianus]TMX68379.1 di-heme enzyme [Vibrio rotiferianus]BBL88423.1 di-heme enzyme [Vibrio rotiferianus]
MSVNQKCGLLASLTIFAIVGCDSESDYTVIPPNAENEFGFDFQTGSLPPPKEPADNPATEEKFQLGRHLFYDKKLSGNQTMSCESCHQQALAFSDGVKVPTGSTGEVLHRNSQTLTNIAYNASYTWANPILKEIEQQLVIPLFGEFPVEMGINDANREEILNRFRRETAYQNMFNAAFPNQQDAVTFPNVIKALAVFNRALISKDSDFDRGTMSSSAMRGQDLFNSEKMECFHCHNGFNFSDSTLHDDSVFVSRPFFNTGLYNIDGKGSYPIADNGLFTVTQDPKDKGKFRPPTLRNIAYTAPYMHDGSIATLGEVLDFYANGGRNITSGEHQGDGRKNPNKSEFVKGFTLSAQEKQDMLMFLHALSDETFISNPRYANPFTQEDKS